MKLSNQVLGKYGIVVVGIFFLLLTGCMIGDAPTPSDSPIPSSASSELETAKKSLHSGGNFKINRKAMAFSFGSSDDFTHGVAGDKRFIFYTEAIFLRRVVVASRFTGQELTTLPPPPGGFLLPFELRILGPGRLAVLDTGGFPSPTAFAVPRVYEYTYSWNRHTRTFSATLVRTVKLENIPFGFSESLIPIPGGSYLISDSVLGQIWVIKPDGTYVPGIAPASFAPQDAIPQLSGCAFPSGVVVDGIPFAAAGGFSPGIGEMVANQTHLFFSNGCGGLYKVPLRVFSDARLPHQRAADIVLVSAIPAGQVEPDTLKGLTFNKYDSNDHKLYAVAPFKLGLVRIDISTGVREDIISDALLFNFPVGLQFLPPLFPGLPAPLIVTSDQEHRFTGINQAISVDQFILPFRLTKVFLRR